MKISEIVGPKRIDLNVDIGEGFPHDEALLEFASSANICCGVHAGSEEHTLQAISQCRARNIRMGAHPGYPDRNTMGRGSIPSGQERAYLKSIFDQVEWFVSICDTSYLKPHGGFYNDTALILPNDWEWSQRKQPLASRYENGGVFLAQYPGVQSLLMLLRIHKLPLMGLASTAHRVIAERAGQDFISEGFADRAYTPEGTLVPRTEPNSVLKSAEEVGLQVRSLSAEVQTICLHGDTEDCLEFAEVVRRTLYDQGFEIAP